jgi:hypothetical protein
MNGKCILNALCVLNGYFASIFATFFSANFEREIGIVKFAFPYSGKSASNSAIPSRILHAYWPRNALVLPALQSSSNLFLNTTSKRLGDILQLNTNGKIEQPSSRLFSVILVIFLRVFSPRSL